MLLLQSLTPLSLIKMHVTQNILNHCVKFCKAMYSVLFIINAYYLNILHMYYNLFSEGCPHFIG